MMKYNDFKKMMSMLRWNVSSFCRGQLPTVDEADSLVALLSLKARMQFYPHGNDDFVRAVCQFIQNEILRVCA